MGSGSVAAILPSARKGVPPVPSAGKKPLAENATLSMDYPRSTTQCRPLYLKSRMAGDCKTSWCVGKLPLTLLLTWPFHRQYGE